ncbi:DUF2490 domain-containing protein [Novosphingobium flavum]|uniref:DUF2490 domain-containing protein n=1 Tax=Novosphingobium flavum TaxID=1778672 RepID=A0A7X1FSU9_9SPHN|nr:DUF2490 domain-containing protein [Novosphingobium flavum]MBC2665837.1 DUF2490 domain-containing protein [Novosphingobium flavum]
MGRKNWAINAIAAATGLTIAAGPARATETDQQIWLTSNNSVDLGEVTVALDFNTRLTEHIKRMSQENARFTVSYRLNPHIAIGGGYFFGYAELPDVPDIVEHRGFEQVTLSLGGLPKGQSLGARTRIEQRFRRDENEMGLRAYEQVRFQAPLRGKLSGIAVVEAAYNLNDTEWGQHAGFSALRGALSLSLPVTRHISVQPGYSGQYVIRWHAEGRFYHAYMFNVVFKG